MNKLKTYLLDDESDSIEVLSSLLQKIPDVQLCGFQTVPELALEEIQRLQPQLLFLDIQMPGMNGFEFLERLKPRDMYVVFLTAYDQFALKAFKYSAADYLLKPVSFTDIQECINKLINRNAKSPELELILENIRMVSARQPRLAIPSAEGVEFFPVEEIIHCMADDNYTHLYLTENRKVTASKTLKEFEKLLEEEQFVRIHQSHLINISHLRKFIKTDGGSVMMSNAQTLPVSRAKKEDLLKKMGLM